MKSLTPLSILAATSVAFAQTPISTESYQLQQLVNTSKQQLKSVNELLDYGKQDADHLDRSSRILEKMSAGIDRSIEKFQGTAVYEKALLKLQSDDLGNQKQGKPALDAKTAQERFEAFQTETIKANLSDLDDQQRLSETLRSAEPGFVPKIQTDAEIRNWRSSARVSSQLTELLANVHGLREDLRSKDQSPSGLAELLEGADLQNQRQREVTNHGPR